MPLVHYWKSLFVGACSVAVFAQSAPPQAPQAQDWEKAAGGKKAFEVASVKLDSGPSRPSNVPLDTGDAFRPVGDRFSADSSVLTYIRFAYKVGLHSAGGAGNAAPAIRKAMQMPEWVLTERYAIERKSVV